MARDGDQIPPDDDSRREPADNWWIIDLVVGCIDIIGWAIVGLVRMIAWVVVGILSSCS